MKSKIQSLFAAGLVCCCCIATLTACNKVVETDDGYVSQHLVANSGAPVIKAVYALTDADQQTPLTEAQPGQRVCIVGENLNNLQSLAFNTVAADLSQTYTALTKAVVKIPQEFSKAHENTIVYTTDQGTVSFPFFVALPEAAVGGLLNEFAKAGEAVAIAGQNLQYYDFTLTLNGTSLPLTVTDQQLSFTIPAGTADNSTFVIGWQNVRGEAKTRELAFRPTQALLFSDITQTTNTMTDKSVAVEKDTDGTPCLHFTGTIGEWSWVELSYEDVSAQSLSAADAADYLFIFEVKTATGKPLADAGYEFAWNGDWDNSILWNPGAGLDTQGEWQTVRLPMVAVTATGGKVVLNVGFQPSTNYEADFRLANFRIEKK